MDKKFSLGKFLFSPEFGNDIRPIWGRLHSIAVNLAKLFISFQILPPDYLSTIENRLSIGTVYSDAHEKLVYTKENVLKILVYWFSVLSFIIGMILLFTTAFSLFVGTAHAEGFFDPPSATDDLAYQWLDYLFKAVPMPSSMFPQATLISTALLGILAFLSKAALFIAGLILLYQLLAMIAETAQTGKPFGNANYVWGPIRVVIALGLLIPTATELNVGQHLVIQVARFGSGLASNAWGIFVDRIANDTALGIGVPPAPTTVRTTENVLMSNACMTAYNTLLMQLSADATYVNENLIKPISKDGGIVFGNTREGPICGSIAFREPSDVFAAKALSANKKALDALMSSAKFKEAAGKINLYLAKNTKIELISSKDFYSLAADYQKNLNSKLQDLATQNVKTVSAKLETWKKHGWVAAGAWLNDLTRAQSNLLEINEAYAPNTTPPDYPSINRWFFSLRIQNNVAGVSSFYHPLSEAIKSYHKHLLNNGLLIDEESETKRGHIAVPADIENPNAGVTDKIADWWKTSNFRPIVGVPFVVIAAGNLLGVWSESSSNLLLPVGMTANPFAELSILGHKLTGLGSDLVGFGLFADVLSIIPMLIVAGCSIAAIAAAGGTAGVGTLALLGIGGAKCMSAGAIGTILKAFSAVLVAVGVPFFLCGVFLTYLLPLIPFIRFFFAVLVWLLAVFEAVVSAPWWALTHLNPKANSLTDGASQRGFFYLFSILLRPVLTVIGLLAGLLMFFVAVAFLNKVFLTAANGSISNAPELGNLSKIMFTFIYVGLIYICANTAFKSIMHFPEHALNWMNASGTVSNNFDDPSRIEQVAMFGAGYGFSRLATQAQSGVRAATGKLEGVKEKYVKHKTSEFEDRGKNLVAQRDLKIAEAYPETQNNMRKHNDISESIAHIKKTNPMAKGNWDKAFEIYQQQEAASELVRQQPATASAQEEKKPTSPVQEAVKDDMDATRHTADNTSNIPTDKKDV